MFGLLKDMAKGQNLKVTLGDSISKDIFNSNIKKKKRALALVKNEKTIKSVLSIQPEVINDLHQVQKDMLSKSLDKLLSLKKNEININGIYIHESEGKAQVGFFIRNGYKDEISIGEVPLALVNNRDQVLGRQIFDLSVLGEIPYQGARPWEVYFDDENIFVSDINDGDWRIVFDIQEDKPEEISYELDNLPKEISQEQKAGIEELIAEMEPVKGGELGISPIHAEITDNQELIAVTVIRNGSKRPVKLEKLYLKINDAEDKEVLAGVCGIDSTIIQPYSAILWNFKFSLESSDQKAVDLSKWSIGIK